MASKDVFALTSYFLFIVALLVNCAVPSSAVTTNLASSGHGDNLLVRMLLGTVESCFSKDIGFGECLHQKTGWLLERAVRLRSLPIMDGVSLVKTSQGSARSLNNEDPLSRIMETFSLQITPPAVLTDPRLLSQAVEEGRGKLKKYLKPLLLIVTAIKAYLFFTAVATLAMFIGKALLVSKVALFLALSALYKKYFGGKKETIEVIKVPHYSQSHHHSEGFHNQHEHSSSSDWEEGSSGSYSSGGDDSFHGSYGGYDKRRIDKESTSAPDSTAPSFPPASSAASGPDLAYRGYRRSGTVGRWSPREEPGVQWKDEPEEGGRQERSSDYWEGQAHRRKYVTHS